MLIIFQKGGFIMQKLKVLTITKKPYSNTVKVNGACSGGSCSKCGGGHCGSCGGGKCA